MDEAIREVTIDHKGNGNGNSACEHDAPWTEGGQGTVFGTTSKLNGEANAGTAVVNTYYLSLGLRRGQRAYNKYHVRSGTTHTGQDVVDHSIREQKREGHEKRSPPPKNYYNFFPSNAWSWTVG